VVEQSKKMAQEMIPDVRVRVSFPTAEHQSYLNAAGRIVDVRDFDEHHFCQVALDVLREAIWFDAHELTVE
jgi:hypothetical protein